MKVTTPTKARPKSGSTPAESVWDEIHLRLEHRRDEILERIGGYPTPIPACDVDFNRLLEERARVFEELNRLATVRHIDQPRRENDRAIIKYLTSCTSLPEDAQRTLRALLQKT